MTQATYEYWLARQVAAEQRVYTTHILLGPCLMTKAERGSLNRMLRVMRASEADPLHVFHTAGSLSTQGQRKVAEYRADAQRLGGALTTRDCPATVAALVEMALFPAGYAPPPAITFPSPDDERLVVYAVQLHDFNGPVIHETLDAALAEVRELLTEEEPPSAVTVTLRWMTRAELEALDEFEGY